MRYWSDLNGDGSTEPLEVSPEHAALVGLYGSGKDLLLAGKATLRVDSVPYALEQSGWRDVLSFWRAYFAKLPTVTGRRKPAALTVLSAGKKRLYALEGEYLTAFTPTGGRQWAVKVESGPYPPQPGQLQHVTGLLGVADAGAPVGEVVAVADAGHVALLSADGLVLAVLPVTGRPTAPLLASPTALYLYTAAPAETTVWQLTSLAAAQRTAATLTLTADDVDKATRALARAQGPK